MRNLTAIPRIGVELSEGTIAKLFSRRTSAEESLEQVICRLMGPEETEKPSPRLKDGFCKKLPVSEADKGKYVFLVFGEKKYAKTLFDVFGKAVDIISNLEPKALEKLSQMRPSGSRNFIARTETNVHRDRSDLPSKKTKAGWWISKNVSKPQVIAALRALCTAAGLDFGKDICFN